MAKSVGYADALYFSRIFKKQVGRWESGWESRPL
ncbi:hypothetical protein [Brevibacillus parabrevis]